MTAFKSSMLATVLFAVSTLQPAAQTLDADELLNLSKTDFLDVYADIYRQNLEITNTLVARMGDEFAGTVDVESPLSEEELASFECSYDILAEAGELGAMLAQLKMIDPIRQRMEDDPEFSYINLVTDEEVLEEMTPPESEAFDRSFSECRSGSVISGRLNFGENFWAKVTEAATAKGLVDE